MSQEKNLVTFTVTIDVNHAKMMISGIEGFLVNFISHTFAKCLIVFTLILIGIPKHVIMDVTGCARSTYHVYLNLVRGLTRPEDFGKLLVMKKGNGRPSKAAGFDDKIVDFIEKNTFRTLKEIAKKIKEEFGISLHITNLNIFLKRNGIKRRMAASLPAKAA